MRMGCVTKSPLSNGVLLEAFSVCLDNVASLDV